MSVLWRIYLLVTLFFALVTVLGLALLLRQAREDVQREVQAAEAVIYPAMMSFALVTLLFILQRLIGESLDWVPLDTYLAQYLGTPEERVTAMASSFASSLELVRQGHVELRQTLAPAMANAQRLLAALTPQA